MIESAKAAYLVGYLWFCFAAMGFLAGLMVTVGWPFGVVLAAVGFAACWSMARDVWRAVR